jgi:hypothetical protein
VVSTAVIPSGTTVLLETRPLLHAVHASRSLQACGSCLSLRLAEVSTKFLPQPIVCRGCAQVAWCSEECANQSTLLALHPATICLAYKRLGEKAAERKRHKDDAAAAQEDAVDLDEEVQSDARLLFHAYSFRRNNPEAFRQLNTLCHDETKTFGAGATAAREEQKSASASASASSAAVPSASASPSAEALEEEQCIQLLHDTVVDCLQHAAKASAQPSPPTADLPSLSKQLTDLHVSASEQDPSDPLASDADYPVTRALYLKLKSNGFALAAPNDKLGNRQTPRGYAVYVRAAMFNHSCMPCVARFDKIDQRDAKYVKGAAATSSASSSSSAASSSSSSSATAVAASLSTIQPSPTETTPSSSSTPLSLELRSMHTIPPYTELTLSYLPLFWDRAERQQQLREEYGFKCRCDRCRLEKKQEREERAKAAASADGADGGAEEEEACAHDDEDEDEGEDDEDDGDNDEDAEEPISSDDEADLAAAALGGDQLSRGELNIYCMKYICPSKICGGTMAPVQTGTTAAAASTPSKAKSSSGTPAGETMVCNVCNKERTDAAFHRQLAKEFGVRR